MGTMVQGESRRAKYVGWFVLTTKDQNKNYPYLIELKKGQREAGITAYATVPAIYLKMRKRKDRHFLWVKNLSPITDLAPPDDSGYKVYKTKREGSIKVGDIHILQVDKKPKK